MVVIVVGNHVGTVVGDDVGIVGGIMVRRNSRQEIKNLLKRHPLL